MSNAAEQVGRVIGGRYRLVGLVGAGASAQVFAAEDARLSRRVAVKLLHPALAGDATFLRKFQTEARLAASLNHRNVLHVYDWGDEAGIPYLVLEYLGGGSLRSLLDTGFLLSPQQAAAIGAEAANGLAYAHRRGLVHRDIKPANLLFDDDGRLVVADFGLARALVEAAITEPLGTVMGTARYASPEQVEGRRLDDRTDVYSLALTLYESVTGRVPFAGDTTASTLIARVGAVLPAARELGPLAPVLAQAAISEPLARLDAASLASELELLSRELEVPEPLPLAGFDIASPERSRAVVADPTQQFGFAPSLEAQRGAAAPQGPVAQPVIVPSATSLPGVRRVEVEPQAHRSRAARKAHKGHRAAWVVAVLVLLALVAGGSLILANTVFKRDTVPHVVGLSADAARTTIHHVGLSSKISGEAYSAGIATGAVVSQLPRPGSREKGGSVVRLEISLGPHPTELQSLAGLSEAAAKAAISKAHLVGHFQAAYSETIVAGSVVSSSPQAGSKLFYGDSVEVQISKGPAPETLPSDLAGGVLTWAQARSALEQRFLVPVESQEYSATIPEGYAIGTKPVAGTTVAGRSSVVVYVSLGPPYVTVPSLYADSAAQAEKALGSFGLKWELYGPGGADFVLTEIPAAGRSVRVGSTVDVYLY
jgi:serine/threonine-protein kinase